MKKTQKEFAEFYGITVGDIVTVYNENGSIYGVFECKGLKAMCPLKVIEIMEDSCLAAMGIHHIGNMRYEVSKPKKKLGECRCINVNCYNCPLRFSDCGYDFDSDSDDTLYEILDKVFECRCEKGYDFKNDLIYKAYKAELDKEVEE